MTLIDDAIDRFVDGLEDENNFIYSPGHWGVTTRYSVTETLRVDYEAYHKDEKTSEQILEDIRALMKRDGPKIVSRLHEGGIETVDIFHGVLYKAEKPKKGATSYTVYALIAVEW